jgi:acetyl-CoA synthetase
MSEAAEAAIDVLLQERREFPPSAEFASGAVASDPGVYERADADLDGFWLEQTRKSLTWEAPPAQGLEWDPPLVTAKPGSATRPFPGIRAAVVDEGGNPVAKGSGGYLVITRPWPGMFRTLYHDDERYVSNYFSRYGHSTYFPGDGARQDADGDFWLLGRVDDVMNVSGHRLSTIELESTLVEHPAVAEAAATAAPDPLTGQTPLCFVLLRSGREPSDELAAELREWIGEKIGKIARPKAVIIVGDLPKTRSGKIMRRLLKDVAEGRELGDTTTLRDPAVVDDLKRQTDAVLRPGG